MDDEDERLMAQLGITAEPKTIFHYAGYRYERLADAVNYARVLEALPENKHARIDVGDEN